MKIDMEMTDAPPQIDATLLKQEKNKDQTTSLEKSKDEPTTVPLNGDTAITMNVDGHLKLQPQKPPLPTTIREHKPPPSEVVVISFGSFGIRYGYASDSGPKSVFPAVAIKRRKGAKGPPLRIPTMLTRSEEEIKTARQAFDEQCDVLVEELELFERRRGGGKPVPWKTEAEPDMNEKWTDESWLLRMEKELDTEDEEKKEESDIKQEDENGDRQQSNGTKGLRKESDVIVGNDVVYLLRNEQRANKYDIIFPMWDGELILDTGVSTNLVRKAVDLLYDFMIVDLRRHRKDSKMKKADSKSLSARKNHEEWMRQHSDHATLFVTLVVPETAQRRDVAELTDAIYRSREMRCGAVFVHQSAVSCALGAGLPTCAVVDIGHSATVIACVEDGIVCGESRIHLRYGFQHVRLAFEELLIRHGQLHNLLVKDYVHTPRDDNSNNSDEGAVNDDGDVKMTDNIKKTRRGFILEDESFINRRICEQSTCFNVDENDTLGVTQVTASGLSERSLRVKLGIGIRAIPAYGLLYPSLLQAARKLQPERPNFPVRREVFQKNSDEDNFVSDIFNDLRRSGIATAALPIGLFANDIGQPAANTVNSEKASIVDAIVWSIAKAIEVKRPDQTARTPDHYRRYLNAIVLAGGGAKIEGIGPVLEGRIKKGFLDVGLNISDVTVIDGGRGKGDEELAAAAAILKDQDDGGLLDDTDTATLPWKGGAVMVEADAVSDYWLYRDDWDARKVHALRERLPFYW